MHRVPPSYLFNEKQKAIIKDFAARQGSLASFMVSWDRAIDGTIEQYFEIASFGDGSKIHLSDGTANVDGELATKCLKRKLSKVDF